MHDNAERREHGPDVALLEHVAAEHEPLGAGRNCLGGELDDRALRGLDLEVADNQNLALLGPTGAGKSSPLLATAGLLDLDAGKVMLQGFDFTNIDPPGRDLAIVFAASTSSRCST